MKLYLSNIKNKDKPDSYKIKKISNTILNNLVDISLEEFAEELAEQGKTVVLAELSENKLSKTTPIIGQELIMLDFDNKDLNNTYTIDDLECDIFMQNHAVFYYRTFSDLYSEVDKFRVVFQLNEVVESNDEIEEIYQKLFTMYPQADSSVGQTNRMFFGSNSSYELIDSDNRLLVDDLLEVGSKEEHSTNDMEVNGQMIDDSLPIYQLLKLKQYDIAKSKLGENFKQEFPDDYNAMNYYKSLNMREFLELPDDNPFIDILHDESNPSASVFFAEQYGIYLYKCFSESKKYTGNIISLLERFLKISSLEVVKLLNEVTSSVVTNTSLLGQSKFNAQKFKKELQSGELKENYPELYNYLSKYQIEIPIILDFMYDYVYTDNAGELKYLNYYSIKNLAKQLSNVTRKNVSLDKTKRILHHIVITEIVKKIPESEVPKEIFQSILLEQKKDINKLRRSNVYEPTNLTDDNKNISEGIAKILRENKVTVDSLSYELVYRLFGEAKAYQDFQQSYEPLIERKQIKMSENDSNLTKASVMLEKTALKIIMKEIDAKGYVYEKEVISKLAKARRLKVRDTKSKYQKIRADVYNKYGLSCSRLTKELYNQLCIEEKYTSRNIIYIMS